MSKSYNDLLKDISFKEQIIQQQMDEISSYKVIIRSLEMTLSTYRKMVNENETQR